jgi:hypothetical protein
MAAPEPAGAAADGMMARSRISYGSDAEAPTDHSRWPRRDRDGSIMLDESDTEVGRMAEAMAKHDGPAHQRKQDRGDWDGAWACLRLAVAGLPNWPKRSAGSAGCRRRPGAHRGQIVGSCHIHRFDGARRPNVRDLPSRVPKRVE